MQTPSIKKIELQFRSHLRHFKSFLEVSLLQSDSWELFFNSLFHESSDYCQKYFKLFNRYQELVVKQHNSKIYCKEHCGGCCHHYPMSVEAFELIYLYSHLRERDDFFEILESCQHRVDFYNKLKEKPLPEDFVAAVKAKNEITNDDNDLMLQYYYMQQQKCPMLREDNNCGVYEFRPIICRMYLSLTPAKYCVPDMLLSNKNENFIVSLPDEIEEDLGDIADILSCLDLPESLFEGLLELNKMEANISTKKPPTKEV